MVLAVRGVLQASAVPEARVGMAGGAEPEASTLGLQTAYPASRAATAATARPMPGCRVVRGWLDSIRLNQGGSRESVRRWPTIIFIPVQPTLGKAA